MQIKAEDNCVKLFNDLKFKKADIRYIIFNVKKEGGERIVVEKVGTRQQNWANLMDSLPETEYRYAVFDAEFVNEDKMNISKIIFIFWTPDNTKMMGKMVYATAKQNFKKSLNLTKDYVICSKQEMSWAQLVKELSK